jgi:hypothetical protein
MLRPVALVKTEVSEENIASIIRVTRISELGTTLAATSHRRNRALLQTCCLFCSTICGEGPHCKISPDLSACYASITDHGWRIPNFSCNVIAYTYAPTDQTENYGHIFARKSFFNLKYGRITSIRTRLERLLHRWKKPLHEVCQWTHPLKQKLPQNNTVY